MDGIDSMEEVAISYIMETTCYRREFEKKKCLAWCMRNDEERNDKCKNLYINLLLCLEYKVKENRNISMLSVHNHWVILALKHKRKVKL